MKTVFTNEQIVEQLGLPASILEALATAQGEEFVATANQFISTLINKIVYTKVVRMRFSNPFAKYEGFPVEYGDTIENIFVELPKGYKFNKDATDPFGKKVPEVKTLYATINYEMQYQSTIQDKLLRRAVKSQYGLMNLIENILAQLGTAKDLDAYQATIAMLNNEDLYADGFEEIDVSEEVTDTAIYKAITSKIISVAHDFALPATDNNALGVMNVSDKTDVLLVIKQSLLDHINLDYLAGVYNLSKTDLLDKIIPVRSFVVKDDDGEDVGEDIDFVIMDANAFDIHTALEDGSSIYNPKGKYTNHFTNLWKIISFKYFYNARAFKVIYPEVEEQQDDETPEQGGQSPEQGA